MTGEKGQQIEKLRQLVIKELKVGTVKKRMIATLKNKNQYASGNLQSIIEKMSFDKSVKITNAKFEPGLILYKATVEFRFNFKKAGYAKFLDIVPYSDIPYKSSGGGIKNLMEWIKEKPLRTWKNTAGIADIRQSKDKRRRLAYAILKSQDKNKGVKNTSRFITFTRSNITSSINRATKSFVDYLSDKLYSGIKSQIFYR
tara:strand:- start:6539 stop:7138 length:600 start_codon:yes stop_codon:yes gene_type:complete